MNRFLRDDHRVCSLDIVSLLFRAIDVGAAPVLMPNGVLCTMAVMIADQR
jgi:hypothetical protein